MYSVLSKAVSNNLDHVLLDDWHNHFMQDGLFLVTNNLYLVKEYSLAVLTPNINEYKHLVEQVLVCEVDEHGASEQLKLLARR